MSNIQLLPSALTSFTIEVYVNTISTKSKIIYWVVILSIVLFLALLPFIYVDVTVQARGYFQADIEKQTIYTPFQGRVVFSPLKNGNRVQEGDTLLIMDTETARLRQNALSERLAENESSVKDLLLLVKIDTTSQSLLNKKLTSSRYQAEFENLRNQLSIQARKYSKRKVEHDRNKRLFDQEIIPLTDFENSLFSLNSERENLNQLLIHQKTLWQNDLTSRQTNEVTLRAELEQCNEELKNKIVIASSGGEIIQCADIQKGSLVNAGQVVAEISPDGELLATCFVRPSDIGLIHEKQKVRIQVDAFNHNEWGMLSGEIVDISGDMIVQNGSSACFRIKCRPEKTFLTLKNGFRADIMKGMSVNTRILVIRRSLFNLLFDKADKWFNPYTYKKES
jgi:membrane fusion protein, peptide pheromone/bacteriocin exporter